MDGNRCEAAGRLGAATTEKASPRPMNFATRSRPVGRECQLARAPGESIVLPAWNGIGRRSEEIDLVIWANYPPGFPPPSTSPANHAGMAVRSQPRRLVPAAHARKPCPPPSCEPVHESDVGQDRPALLALLIS